MGSTATRSTSAEASTVWTARQRWKGNLIPSLIWLAFAAVGVLKIIQSREPMGEGLVFILAGTLLAWLSVNWLGLWGNSAVQKALDARLKQTGRSVEGEKFFVGFASPGYAGALDPHEDVGYLVIYPDRLEFRSETRTVLLGREHVKSIGFRPNAHTLVGMGRWVSIEGVSESKRIRMQIEPREKNTLWGNLAYGKWLRGRLRQWMAVPSPKVPTSLPNP